MTTTRRYNYSAKLNLDQHYYILRRADDELLKLCLDSEYAYVFNASQTGKSSLLAHTRRELEKDSISVANVDLQGLGSVAGADEWYCNVARLIAKELKLSTDVDDWWAARPSYTPTLRWVTFLAQVVLSEIQEPVAILIDEVDTTRVLPFRHDIYGAFRSLRNARPEQPELQRLTFVLAGLAMPHELISDATETGHNIWKGVSLGDLTENDEGIVELAEGLGMATAEKRTEVLGWILSWTGGHPYLTQKLCARVQEQEWKECSAQQVDELVEVEFLNEPNETNLLYVEGELTKERENGVTRTAVLAEYERVLSDSRVHDSNTAAQAELKQTGVVKVEDEWLQVRNRIYQAVFDKQWLKRRFHPSLQERWAIQPRLVKHLVTTAAALIILMLLFSGVFVGMRIQAQKIANQSHSRELAADAQILIGEQFPQLRLLLALEALDVTRQAGEPPVIEAKQALYDALVAPMGVPLVGHNEEIVDYELSPDEHWLATGSMDDIVMVWDLQQIQKAACVLSGHSDDITILAFSPDSHQLASGSRDDTIRIWDIQECQLEQVLEHHKADIATLLFSPDGRWLLTTSEDRSGIPMWNGISTSNERGSNGCQVEYDNPDEAPTLDDHALVWDLKDSTAEPKALTNPEDGASRFLFEFSHDGRWLITYDDACKVILIRPIGDWEADPFEIILPFEKQLLSFYSLSPDGRMLASIDEENRMHLWDLTKSPVALVNSYVHDNGFANPYFSPDGKWLLAQSSESLLWKISDPSFQPRIYEGDISISPDGRWLLYIPENITENILQVWSTQSLDSDPVTVLEPVDRFWLYWIAFSPNGRWIVAEGPDGIFRVWDLDAPDSPPVALPSENLFDLKFSPDERWLIGEGDLLNNTIRVWDMNDLTKEPLDLPGHDRGPETIFSSNGRWLITHDIDTTRVWDTTEWSRQFAQSEYILFDDTLFSPDGRQLFTADTGDEDQILIWDATSPVASPVSALPNEGYPRVMTISSDGRWLLTTHEWYDAKLWNYRLAIWDWLNPGTEPVMKLELEDDVRIEALATSLDGKWLAVAGEDSIVRVWKWDPPTETTLLKGKFGKESDWYTTYDFNDTITAIAFSPDGKRLLVGKWDGTVLIWNLNEPNRTPRKLDGHTSIVFYLAFSADGRQLITASSDQTIRLWNNWENSDQSIILWGRNVPFAEVTLGTGGQLIAAYEDGIALVWDLKFPMNRPYVLRGQAGDFAALTVSADGRWLKSVNANGDVSTWDLTLEGVIETACDRVGRNFTQNEWIKYFPDVPYRKTCEQWPVGE